MYKVELKNKYGSVKMGTYNDIQLTDILGIGLPSKSVTSIEFSDGAGIYSTSERDNSRTVTLKGDFYGDREEIKRIYRVIFHECEIRFIFGNDRRKIKGRCINPEDFKKIGGGITSFAIQFECDIPYFEDFYITNIAILKRINYFPNLYEDGQWYIQLSDTSYATKRYSEGDVKNCGDIEIYPVLKIQNTSDAVALTDEQIDICNETSDAHIKLNYNISAGEIITVNLPEREIISSINGDITHYISDDTQLSKFKLLLGNNHISVTSTASTSSLICAVEYNNNYAWAVL